MKKVIEYFSHIRIFVQRKRINVALFGYGKSSIVSMLIQGDIYRENNMFRINDDEKAETVNMGGYMTVLSSNESAVAQVIDVVPITIGPAYQLISSDVYCKLGKSKEAKKTIYIWNYWGCY
jgi:hypothetical protein